MSVVPEERITRIDDNPVKVKKELRSTLIHIKYKVETRFTPQNSTAAEFLLNTLFALSSKYILQNGEYSMDVDDFCRRVKLTDLTLAQYILPKLNIYFGPIRSLLCNKTVLRYLCELVAIPQAGIDVLIKSFPIDYPLTIDEFSCLILLGFHNGMRVQFQQYSLWSAFEYSDLKYDGFCFFNVCGEDIKVSFDTAFTTLDSWCCCPPSVTLSVDVCEVSSLARKISVSSNMLHIYHATKIEVLSPLEFEFDCSVFILRSNLWKFVGNVRGQAGYAFILDKKHLTKMLHDLSSN